MNDFFSKIRNSMNQFMQGRRGTDELAMATLIMALVFSILTSLTGIALFNLLSLALYIYTIYRIFSRDVSRRAAENAKYQKTFGDIRKKVTQFFRRLKNSKEYKYCRCPKCKILYRAKRGSGEKHIVCKQCGEEFDIKA